MDGFFELVPGGVVVVVGDGFSHEFPESFDGIEVGAIRWQVLEC